MKRLASRLPLVLALAVLTGCQSFPGSFCRIYEPIPTRDETPDVVQLAINRNNVVYCRRCDSSCPL